MAQDNLLRDLYLNDFIKSYWFDDLSNSNSSELTDDDNLVQKIKNKSLSQKRKQVKKMNKKQECWHGFDVLSMYYICSMLIFMHANSVCKC